MPKQSKMKQNLHKNTIELLWCWSARSLNGARLGMWLIFPVSLHWGKLILPLPADIDFRQLRGQGWNPWPLPMLSAGTPSSLNLQVDTCYHSLHELMHASVLFCLKDTVSLESSIISDSYNISAFSSEQIPQT